ncbi:MAG: glycosyltransferase family 4 protein [Bdellovibrionales bacterium]|nr:glycosyltransferase family 4 protein [Bdellovibrionales bacterium]
MKSVRTAVPKVMIDARMVGPIPHGIARFVDSIALGLSQLQERQGQLSYLPVFMMEHSQAKRREAEGGFHGFPVLGMGSPFLSPKEWWEISSRLRLGQADLYHSPSFASLPAGFWPRCPWVLTIHDLNHRTFGGWKEKLYYSTLLRPFAERAAVLTTVSETSRSEIFQWIERSQIDVIPNSLSPKLADPVSDADVQAVFSKPELSSIQPGKFFFCLSNPKPHKNARALADSFQQFLKNLGQSQQRPKLIFSFDGFEDEPSAYRNIPEIVFLPKGSCDDRTSQVLLKSSAAFFFPSLYEGFGLPPLEAALAGARLVISKIDAHLEALRDLSPGEVHWVSPEDHHGWVQAFHRAMRDDLMAVRPESGRRILDRYTPLATGQAVDRVYRSVLGTKK